jgi:hypothetical protein
MREIKDGGAAFPLTGTQWNPDRDAHEVSPVSSGMSLRDYLAAKAMQGILAMEPAFKPNDGGPDQPFHAGKETHVSAVAKGAYSIADAMLEARKV